MNFADYRLYNYYKNKLEKEINKIGKDKINKIKNKIISRAKILTDECIQETNPNQAIMVGVGSNPAVKVEKQKNQTCQFLVQGYLYDL